MNFRMTALGLAAFGIFSVSGLRSFASTPADPSHRSAYMAEPGKEKDEKDEKDEKEVKVELDKLPAAVVATVKKELPDGTMTEAVIKEKDGKKIYEIDVKSGGIAYEIKTAEDGTFKSKKVDDDEADEKK